MGTAAQVDSDLGRRARQFHRFYRLITALAIPNAVVSYLRLRVRSPAGFHWLLTGGYSPWKVVYAVAAARLARRVQRATGGRPSPAVVWPKTIPSSCVIAFFHSAWDLVIAREVASRQYCLVRAGSDWAEDLGRQHVAWNAAGLRSLVRRVATGGRCAAAMDNFVDDAAGGLFGTRAGPNRGAARLAAATGAPLVPVWFVYERGVLRIDVGPPIAASTCACRQNEALHSAREFFENAVRRDPAGWPRIVSFLQVNPWT